MNILYTAFNGKLNTSKILLDNLSGDKLCLKNSFTSSITELYDKIKDNCYDLIICFGQASLDKNTIRIELIGKGSNIYKTNYDYHPLQKKLEKYFNVVISRDAGHYLCNNLYYHGLKYIKDNNLKSKIIFIHIPKINNININLLRDVIIGE